MSAWIGLALLVAVPSAHAQEASDPGLTRIGALADQLGSDDAAERRAAYDALTTLDAELVPAIRARLAQILRRRPEPDVARDIFRRIRHAAGSRRADDDIDIAPGVLPVLAEERSAAVRSMVEPILLWRALERIATFEAGQAMYPLFALNDDLWNWEKRRVVDRMGGDIMAAAIAGRTHEDVEVRRWAGRAMRRLGADDPGQAVQALEPGQLADVMRAYAILNVQSAMRVIVSYVDSRRRSVRRAAREAIAEYGANAIWILRTEYHTQTGEHAPERWGWRRVAERLYADADARRMEPVRRAREAGLAALAEGDFDTMRARFEEVLARAPDLGDPEPIAAGYAASAREAPPQDAAWAYRRALRLAPEHPDAVRWRAELDYLRAQRALANGVLNEALLREVLAAVPEHDGARRLLARAAPPATAPTEDRTGWGLGAAFLLAAAGGVLLRRRRPAAPVADDVDDEPTLPDAEATLVDATLPG